MYTIYLYIHIFTYIYSNCSMWPHSESIQRAARFLLCRTIFLNDFFIGVLWKYVDAPTKITMFLGFFFINERYWSPVNRHESVECKKAHGETAMAWVGIIDGRCLPDVWFDGSVINGEVYLEKVLKGTVWQNVSTRWSKLPRYRTMFVIFAIEIRRSNHLSQHVTSLATIFARPFTTGPFFLEPMHAICEEGEAQEHMWSPSARQQICREHRWRSFEKNGAAQQKTSCSLYWFTWWSHRAVTVNIC